MGKKGYSAKQLFHSVVLAVAPTVYYVARYWQARPKVLRRFDFDATRAKQGFLARANQAGRRCLQIGVKEDAGAKFGPNWESVDLYDDRSFIDHHYDVRNMGFANDTFDAIAAISILEHIPDPWNAIKELHRVLKPGGEIYVTMPMTYPYHESPEDYWRATPEGLAHWMGDGFERTAGGAVFWTRSPLAISAQYFGRKR